MNDLQKRLDNLLQARDEIDHEIFVEQALHAPIRKIPNEILTMIFFNCVEEKNSFIIGQLVQVCRLWHHIIHQNNKFWCHIHFRYKDNFNVRIMTSYIQLFLERSGECYLDIEIEVPNVLSFDKRSEMHAKEILRQAADLKEGSPELLEICSDFDNYSCGEKVWLRYSNMVFEPIKILVGNNGVNMNRWRSLAVKYESDWLDDNPLFMQFAYPTPNLHSLSIQHSTRTWNKHYHTDWFPDLSSLAQIDLDFFDITNFKIDPLKISHISGFRVHDAAFTHLSLCVNLVALEVGEDHLRYRGRDHSKTTFHHLRTLRIKEELSDEFYIF